MAVRLTIEDVVSLTHVNRVLARSTHEPFAAWQDVVRVLRNELKEFEEHAVAGHRAQMVNELAGIAAAAQLAATELPLAQ